MKKLLVGIIVALALAIPASANSAEVYALMKLPNGVNCTTSTSPPCTLFSFSPGYLQAQNTEGLGIVDCNFGNGYGCWVWPGGIGYGQYGHNVTLGTIPAWRVGQYNAYARQACPNGVSWKYSATKSMQVDPNISFFVVWSNLQIIDNDGCLPT